MTIPLLEDLVRGELTELLGGIGNASPGPLFLVDHVGRSHALNDAARLLGETDAASEAFVSPVQLGAARNGRVVGYVPVDAAADDAPMVAALVALAAGIVTRGAGVGRESGGAVEVEEPVLDEACERLATLADEAAISDVVVEAAREALDARWVVLLSGEPGRDALVPVAVAGEPPVPVAPVELGRGLVGWAATRAEPTTATTLHRLPSGLPAARDGGPALEPWLDLPLVVVPIMTGPQLGAVLCACGLPPVPGRDVAAAAARRLRRLADRAAAGLAGARMIRQVRRQERVARELEIAQQIQSSLLTHDDVDFASLDVAGECVPASQVGGDFLGLRLTGPDELTATVFDVAGHGLGAAFCMTLVRAALNGELARGGSLDEVLARANELVFEDVATSGLFATALLARFDRRRGVLRYASAGHCRPVHWSAGERRFQDHPLGGLPLGLLADAAHPEGVADFGAGDLFVAYTDGIVEARNRRGEPFGRHRILGIVHRSRRRPARAVLAQLRRSLEAFTEGETLRDDATLLVVKGLVGFGTRCPAPTPPRIESRAEADPAAVLVRAGARSDAPEPSEDDASSDLIDE